MKRREKWKTVTAWITLTLSVCAMAIFGYQLLKIQQTYRIGDTSYRELTNLVRPSGSPVFQAPQTAAELSKPSEGPAADPVISLKTEVPVMDVNFETLRTINPDGAAWLYSPGTVIDYPVMRATDYDYYLHHLPDGTLNDNGSLFIDYNNAPDFSDQLTVIYGHHMKSGQMFGSLNGYKQQAYYKEHPYMYLYTDQENYRIDLIYGCVIAAGEWRERAFMYAVNLDAFLAYAAYNTTFTSDTRYAPGDRVVAMSTCSYEFDGARYVVVGVLRPDSDGK